MVSLRDPQLVKRIRLLEARLKATEDLLAVVIERMQWLEEHTPTVQFKKQTTARQADIRVRRLP
jgi:hypothetical protein